MGRWLLHCGDNRPCNIKYAVKRVENTLTDHRMTSQTSIADDFSTCEERNGRHDAGDCAWFRGTLQLVAIIDGDRRLLDNHPLPDLDSG